MSRSAPGSGKRAALVAIPVLLALLGFLAVEPALGHGAAAEEDAHAHHHHHVTPETSRSTVRVQVPDVLVVRSDGQTVQLRQEIDDGRPVVVSFIYTSCTTICPVTSQILSELQSKLGAKRELVHLVSISIDPEQDTPARLREYERRFGAGAGWQHYTGTVAASQAAQRAFGVYRGSKMDHEPVTLLRSSPTAAWVRIDGFPTADQLLSELHDVVASR